MKRWLKFFGGLLAALLVHLVAVRWIGWWSLAFDLLLVVAVFHALDGHTLRGLLGGLLAGWVTDAVTGSPFGLFGLVDTIVCYGTAFAVQRLVIQRAASAGLLFAVASIAQQVLVTAVGALVSGLPDLPHYTWWVARAASSGVLGASLFAMNEHFATRVDLWRRTRRSRIRLER